MGDKKNQPMHTRIGFESDILVTDLLNRLVGMDCLDQANPHYCGWTAPSAGVNRARCLLMLGMKHQHLHGLTRGRPTCTKRPCQAAGLSAAIVEIATYLLERNGPIATLSYEIEQFPHPVRLMEALRYFIVSSKESELSVSCAQHALNDFESAIGALENVYRLLPPLESPQFQQADEGNPTKNLLREIYRHLHYVGGFSLKELAGFPLDEPHLRALMEIDPSPAAQKFINSKAKSIRRYLNEEIRTWSPYVGAN